MGNEYGKKKRGYYNGLFFIYIWTMALFTTTVPTIPSAGFIIDRDEIVVLVKAQNCLAAKEVSKSNTYEELTNLLVDYINTFSCINMKAYLDSLLNCVDDAIRISNLVFHDSALLVSAQNPRVVSKSVFSDQISIAPVNGPLHKELIICNGSTVPKIVVETGMTLDLLVISGGSVVNELVIQDGATVKSIVLQTCEGTNADIATLSKITGSQSNVWNISKGVGAVLGGFECMPTTTTPTALP